MKDIWTIRKILAWTTSWFNQHGIESARLDAEILLAKAIGVERIDLYLAPDKPLTDNERNVFKTYIKRRAAREPIAYIIGTREFYGRSFCVDSRVLIPRPDTETIIEVLKTKYTKDCAPVMADIGAGSGCLGITAALEFPESFVYATDVSRDALDVANMNARKLIHNSRFKLLKGSFYSPLKKVINQNSLDIIVSNPPYIRSSELKQLQPEVSKYEPHIALDGGEEGLDAITILIRDAILWLKPDGWIIIEIGYDQAEPVKEILSKSSFKSIMITSDLAGVDRVVSACIK